jgi:hypothetical protein
MSTTSSEKSEKTTIPNGVDARVLERVLDEGYGPGAWHGADFTAALSDVPAALAFWRPARDRHNIAEIAVHHAYCVHGVRAKLAGGAPEPFILDGDDWFDVSDAGKLSWTKIKAVVEREQGQLADAVAAIASGRIKPGISEQERFDLVLGITCHGVYHAGQVQFIKRLHAK